MDTRTRTASPVGDEHAKLATPPPVQDKISAYYSLVFPHFTFYIQTLSITIGRRCAPNAATSSTAEQSQVDVDLGALKSVSRLHAKIEYDQEEDRFVLAVIGRNGAWVDGVWSGAGTRAPLGERSQIQIASRTFHFVLPPPPPPEDTPSPSSQSSANRPRSPSVDITSISPPSSQPSHSPPPPVEAKLSLPPLEPLSQPKAKGKAQAQPTPQAQYQPQLPNSNAIGKSGKANSKKRKKSDSDPPPVLERPKPEDMPPKPPFTYAQLIYRAIKAIGGKATLQEVCTWIMNTHEYYRFADGAWMSSVRHNLSSGRAFLKMERCGGDRGKGFFWSIDEKHAQTLEEQESKSQQAAATQGTSSGSVEAPPGKRKKDKGASLLEPPLKRSVKGDIKGALLPPPLTSTPLPFKNASYSSSTFSAASTSTPAPAASSTSPPLTTASPAISGVFPYPSHPHRMMTMPQQASALTSGYSGSPMSAPNPYAALTQTHWGVPPPPINPLTSSSSTSTATHASTTPPPSTSTVTPGAVTSPRLPLTTQQPLSGQTPVPDVVIPIILGPIPPTHPDYAPNHSNNSAKEGYMVLHERKLILDPDVFSGLTKEMLENLEKMGARAALAVLTTHMVKALKERRAKGRGKDRGGRRPRGTGARGGLSRKTDAVTTAPFTNVPLDHTRKLGGATLEAAANVSDSHVEMKPQTSFGAPILNPVASGGPSSITEPSQATPGSPLIVVDDSEDEGHTAKKRKANDGLALASR
ncbi:hypothetical protein B0H34DRAFT_670984 [Crassisporium funariophilum]|nr:hypothetical protein B0H34DRAFT_670984 [Crassisporium funariophilum]